MNLMERSYSVLIASASETINNALMELLTAPGYDSVRKTADISSARRMLAERSFDIVVINSPLPDDPGYRFAIDASGNKGTVVLAMIQSELYGDIRARLSPYGVFLVRKPLSRQTLEDAMNWMISARERIRNLEKKTVRVEEKMDEIRLVNRAKWVLIRELNMDEPSAHRYIEKQAMDRCVTRREIAEGIIRTYS